MHWARVWLIETPFFIHFVASLLFGPLGWLVLLIEGLAHVGHYHVDLRSTLAWLYAGSFALGAYATLVRRFWVRIRPVEVQLPGLDSALDGMRLVQLSDVHCGPYMPRRHLRYLARRANSLGADAIVLTGDMITHGTAYVDDLRDFVRQLHARLGVFASMGNHDYFGAVNEVDQAMVSGGATVLRNAGVSLEGPRGGAVYLAAVDDSWTQRHDIARAMSSRTESDSAAVLIAHDPDLFPTVLAHGGVDLVLSGHTHGGQFAVPFFSRRWNLARIRFRYTLGLYREGSALLYVHAGNGTSGPPARFGVAPEIAVITLRAASRTSTS
jgi:predicted MPP superfamily phosphohydrolase